jgi:hypothetical protein
MLFTALLVSTVLKVYLALASPNTADANAFVEFLNHIRKFGVTDIYKFRGSLNNIFNFPPPMIDLIRALGILSDFSHLPFIFWLRLLPSLADVGSFFVTWRLLQLQKDQFKLLALLALCPTSIFINGFEGNVDGAMIFFILLSIWFIESHRPLWTAGMALGMAMSIKYVPLMLVPIFFFYLPVWRSRIEYFGVAFATLLVGSAHVLLADPGLMTKAPVGYSSIYGVWGLTNLFVKAFGAPQYLHYPYEPVGIHDLFSFVLKYLTMGVILVLSIRLNRKSKAPLPIQCGLVIALFLFLTPGFGIQYLVWLVPFVAFSGVPLTLIYYASTTLLVTLVLSPLASWQSAAIMYLCWISTALCAWGLWQSGKGEMSSRGHLSDPVGPR